MAWDVLGSWCKVEDKVGAFRGLGAGGANGMGDGSGPGGGTGPQCGGKGVEGSAMGSMLKSIA